MFVRLKYYVLLTKPRIMLLVVFTGATSMFMRKELCVWDFLLVLVGLYLTGGCANALNQCFEYKIDAKMSRTASKRPLPQNKLSVVGAVVFSCVLGVLGVALFWWLFNEMSALLSLGSILFYSVAYTLFLKPTTPQNIVIGGASGAMPPVIAWAAVSHELWDAFPWLLFCVIFLWTPPHFWALALYHKEDYVKSGFPMYPIVKGDEATARSIVRYVWALLVCSVSLPLASEYLGVIYVSVAGVLGWGFLKRALSAQRLKTEASQKSLFLYSIAYLFLLFIGLIVDRFV